MHLSTPQLERVFALLKAFGVDTPEEIEPVADGPGAKIIAVKARGYVIYVDHMGFVADPARALRSRHQEAA